MARALSTVNSISPAEPTAVGTAFQSSRAGARDIRLIVGAIAAPALVAWLLLVLFDTTELGDYVNHERLGERPGAALLVLAGWVVMTAAMMLPTTAPLMRVFRTVVGRRPHPGRLVLLVILGYLAVWTLVGGLALAGDTALHSLLDRFDDDTTHRWVATVVFAGAGVYQFTPLKRRCLDSCQSPFLFVSAHWRGNDPRWDSFALGAAHGWFCVGCCWTLMLTMFAVGMGNLAWMFIAGTLMAAEKNIARLRWLGPMIGVGLLVAALVVAVR